MPNILITGGAGFIGYHLALFHSNKNHNVFILDNFSKTKSKDNYFKKLISKKNVTFIKTDLTKKNTSIKNKIPKKIEILYHLAAINGTRFFYDIPYELSKKNIQITINLLDSLSNIKISKFVYSSSSEIYANSDKLGLVKYPTDESVVAAFSYPLNPRLSYGISKFVGEFLISSYCTKMKIKYSTIRFHNIFGERMGYNHVIPELIQKLILNKKKLEIFGGNETRSFCYIDDAIKSIYLVAKKSSLKGRLIHIGNSENEIIIKKLAAKIIKFMSLETNIVDIGKKSLSVNRRNPNTSELKKITGFKANISLDVGLKKTIKWYVKDLIL